MAKSKGAAAPKKETADRNNGKAFKQHPKVFDATKRRLVSAK